MPRATRAPRRARSRSSSSRPGVREALSGLPHAQTPAHLVTRLAARAAVSAARAAAAAIAARTFLALLARRRVLCPLDQLLGLDEAAVLVLRDQLEADPAAILVDLLDEH